MIVGCAAACGPDAPAAADPGSDAGVADAVEANDASAAGDSAVGAARRFVPIHLTPSDVFRDAPDVTLTGEPSSIDTQALTIDGAKNPYFLQRGKYAVLFANHFVAGHDIVVTGTLPLIIVAYDDANVMGSIDLSAHAATPGPGAAVSGPGLGGPGATFLATSEGVRISSGGGGAGYGSPGAPGGGDGSLAPAGTAGMVYGARPSDPLIGGAPGGVGGDGSAEFNIGAGGEIFLEAPQLTIASTLAANGGGGGAGGSGVGGVSSTDGADGAIGATTAPGGSGLVQGSNGGAGAAGPAGSFVDARPGEAGNSKAGGGGAGGGRIWLRYRATTPPVTTGAVISPPAGLDPTLSEAGPTT